MEENGIKQAQRLYKLCCSFGFGSIMLQFVWPVIVFWYLAFSLPKCQRVRESDTDEETHWFLSQWKCDNGERKMTLLVETDRFTLGRGPRVTIGPVWAPGISLGPEWWVTWSRSICLNVEYVHYTSEAELCQCCCWTQIIAQQLMCVDSSSRRWLLKWSNTHIYRSISNCLC